jgi:hypothetical protein
LNNCRLSITHKHTFRGVSCEEPGAEIPCPLPASSRSVIATVCLDRAYEAVSTRFCTILHEDFSIRGSFHWLIAVIVHAGISLLCTGDMIHCTGSIFGRMNQMIKGWSKIIFSLSISSLSVGSFYKPNAANLLLSWSTAMESMAYRGQFYSNEILLDFSSLP